MRRHARANPLVRRQINALLRELKVSSADGWPTHLVVAHKILADQLAIPVETARSVIAASVSVAYVCAKAIDQRAGNIVELQTRNKLLKTFKLIGNCAKRAPTNLRTRLNAAIVPFIQGEHFDLESIEAIFDAAVEVFSEYPHQEAAKTALAMLTYQPPGGERYVTVKNDFPGLSAKDRIKSEKALAALRKVSQKKRATASDVFAALAGVLQGKRYAKVNSQIHALIVDYVAIVADIWRRAGLRPSRARDPTHPAYKSRFHRFVDLVLTEMVEPWARRHGGNMDEVGRQTQLAYEKLPPESRTIASPALKRGDVDWLVSDDHIKKALRRRSKNRR